MRSRFYSIVICLAAVFLTPAQSPSLRAVEKIALVPLPYANVTVLVDNMAGVEVGGPILGEWGASLLLETDKNRILIDTGAGQALISNARAMKVDLGKTEAIVLSHEHGDHTNGLEQALKACGLVDLYVHPAAFETRYWKEGSTVEPHRLPFSRQQLTQRVRKLVETKEPTAIREGVMVTGQIPRLNDFEDTGVRENAFLDQSAKAPDPIADDQAIFFRVPEGVVILLGCGHAGLVNTMQYVCQLLGESEIYAVMGGTHLVGASPRRVQQTIAALRRYKVQKVLLSHCTGLDAYVQFASAFPGRCQWPASGTRIRFGRQ